MECQDSRVVQRLESRTRRRTESLEIDGDEFMTRTPERTTPPEGPYTESRPLNRRDATITTDEPYIVRTYLPSTTPM